MSAAIAPKAAYKRLSIVLFLWRGWRPTYEVAHVRALARQLREHLHLPYRVVLLTDQKTTAAECEVDEVLPLSAEPRGIVTRRGINCFRRLELLCPEYSRQFGTEWVMSLDLDSLLLDDITEAIEWGMNDFGFCIVRGRLAEVDGQRPYNGSMWMVRVGEHRHVWDEFSWDASPKECADAGWVGSDQVWLSLKLRGAPTWSVEHGVYFVGQYLESLDDAPEPKLLCYAGHMKPWNKMSKRETPELWREYQRYLD